LVPQDRKVRPGLREHQARRDRRVLRDPVVLRECKESMDKSDLQARRGPKEFLVCKANRAHKGKLEHKARKVCKVLLDLLEHRDHRAMTVLLVFRVRRERWGLKDHRAHKEWMGPLVHKVSLVPQAPKALRVFRAPLDLRGCRANKVSWDHRVLKDLKV
jgi:hypothetical protein